MFKMLKQKSAAKKWWVTPGGDYVNLYKDMLQQKHLLIAGETGSGKSVVVNELMRVALLSSPVKVNFILIDPKRVELVDYKYLPHTMRYASEPDDMIEALEYAINLTEDRYTDMQKKRLKLYDGSDVYVIIDEFADLMTTNRKRVQPLIQRLCQIGRAAKIHVIVCTQSPIAKVIPTEIKVNFDSRLGLRTSCAQDSRNILGVNGCEALPEYGYGYYKRPGSLIRVPLPMSEQSELERVIEHWLDGKKCMTKVPPTKSNSGTLTREKYMELLKEKREQTDWTVFEQVQEYNDYAKSLEEALEKM